MKKLKQSLIRSLSQTSLFRYIARKAGYVEYRQHVPPGHFYSPIADLNEVKAAADRIFDPNRRTLPAINLREKEQLELLQALSGYYREQPFTSARQDGLRYYFNNDLYCHSDAIFLYSIIRHFRPRRIIEAGSGFSSCVMLDTNQRFFDGKIRIDLIEPYPERLYSLLLPGERGRVNCHEKKLQDVPLDFFRELNENDILFIDSSHVCRVGSEVNYYLFEILPALKPGVLIHIHDVFNGFEYPRQWIEAGISWSEDYLLRAFLQYNDAFEIVIFNTFLEHFHRPFFSEHMPLCLENEGGSIWLRKTRE
jgi:predicted O-methyltransferase YrrM